MSKKSETDKARRAEKNKELLERMRDKNDPLSNFSAEQSHFPNRPKIKKDKKLVDKLFAEDDDK